MMASSMELSGTGMVAVPREAFAGIRDALVRQAGADSAALLQVAGYAGGPALFDAFSRWLASRGRSVPESLPAQEFGQLASEFFRDAGWGSIELGELRGAVATVDTADWSEADAGAGLEIPGCFFTTGLFVDFFGHLAGSPLAVMEVECRSTGAPRCRFLLGSDEVMQHVYDEMGRGTAYEQAVERVG